MHCNIGFSAEHRIVENAMSGTYPNGSTVSLPGRAKTASVEAQDAEAKTGSLSTSAQKRGHSSCFYSPTAVSTLIGVGG